MRNSLPSFVILPVFLTCSGIAASGSLAQTIADRQEAASFAPLDGKTFEARIVPQAAGTGPAEPLLDQLFFDNGTFSSKICERYGFLPGMYWIRGTPDEIQFQAVLYSPTDGTMEWSGTVINGQLEGTMRWTRERWYWTINAEHRIAGELSAQPPSPGGSD